jgi:thiamine transport system permease protein
MQKDKSSLKIALWLAPVIFLGLFYFYPLGKIVTMSLARSQTGLLTPVSEAFTSPIVRSVLWFTVWQAVLSTLLTLLIGLPGAYLLARYDFRGKSLFQALAGIPFVMPTLVVAAAFNTLLGSHGWLNLILVSSFHLSEPPIRLTNTIYAILLAHIFYNTTIVLRMVGDFWAHLDPRIVQAGRTLGANRRQTLWHITLPLLAPAILAAALLVFIFDFTSFGVILVLGGPRFATLEVEIYYQTISLFNLPLAAVLSVLQLLCTLGLTLIYTRLTRSISHPLSLKSRQFTQRRLTTWRSRLLALGLITMLLVFLIVPLLGLGLSSITRLEADRGQASQNFSGFTLDYYRQLTINRQESFFYVAPTTAITISFGYAIATVILSLALGMPAAWALARDEKSTLNRLLDPILMLPLGTSAVTLGLGFIVALNHPPIDLRASPLLVPFAHTLVAFPFVVRSLVPALKSIQPRLRQAAAVLGASPIHVIRYIDLPLVGKAMIVAATFAFSISMGEFGATSLIARPEFPTIPLVIYRYITSPGPINYGQALALSTILMVVTAAGMLAIERFRIAEVGEF